MGICSMSSGIGQIIQQKCLLKDIMFQVLGYSDRFLVLLVILQNNTLTQHQSQWLPIALHTNPGDQGVNLGLE